MKEFENKVVVITGADRGIGLAIRRSFESEGARVYSIDLKGDGSYKGDIDRKSTRLNSSHKHRSRMPSSA